MLPCFALGMQREPKPPRPSDTPPMLGGAKASLPLGGGNAKQRIAEYPPLVIELQNPKQAKHQAFLYY